MEKMDVLEDASIRGAVRRASRTGAERDEQHAGARRERRKAARADELQDGGTDAEASGDADGVQRNISPAIGFVGESIDPEFCHDEKRIQRARQHEPHRKPQPQIGHFVNRDERPGSDNERQG